MSIGTEDAARLADYTEVQDRVRKAAQRDPIRVLLVDDDVLFRTAVRGLLEEEGFEVADSVSGPAAVRRAPSFAPDVVVMAMNMPGMTGVEATPLVLQAAPQTSIVVLTIATDDAGVLDAIRAGAAGYLLKDAELNEITAGIRAAAAGHCPIAPRVASALLQAVRSVDNGSSQAAATPAGPQLSPREQQVLRLLSEGCENAEIAARLYLSQSTVKTCVSKLLEKLGVDNRVQAATYAIRNNFALAHRGSAGRAAPAVGSPSVPRTSSSTSHADCGARPTQELEAPVTHRPRATIDARDLSMRCATAIT